MSYSGVSCECPDSAVQGGVRVLFQVDYNSGEPISRQVVAQVKWMVASGRLQPGEKLPSIRQLAKQLKVNPTTVTRIYNELSSTGVIALRQGQGAFVTSKAPTVNRAEARKSVQELARRLIAESSRLGLTSEDVTKIVQQELKRITGKPS